MTVLILARDIEPQVDRVVDELARRSVPVFRTDLAAFPTSLTLDARLSANGWEGTLTNAHRQVKLSEIRSVWYRHPSHFLFPEGLSRPERRHAAAEARCGVGGVLSGLDALWVNRPSREADAVKPRQLAVARRCGLTVPDTIVTNDPDAVRAFASQIPGPVAGKNLSAAVIAEAGGVHAAYTRRLDPADMADLRGVQTTAHLFQEFMEPKAFEARVTVVGDRVFAAAIHAHSATAARDYRADYANVTYSRVTPPDDVTDGMLAFMDVFGLSFGCFDFAITPGGEWVMFECNPFGQYGWIEDELGFPITTALVDLLAEGAPRP